MNPLNNYPRVRAILYLVQWVVNGAVTVLSAAFAFQYGADFDDWPRWFLGVIAVAPVLWTVLGLTAQQNTPALVVAPTYHDGPDEVHDITGAPLPGYLDEHPDERPEHPGASQYRE